VSDYEQRIIRLQSALRGERASLAVISFTDQMRYLAGMVENGHERLLALLVPAEGEPAFIVPAINAAQFTSNPAGIERIVPWDDATGPAPALAGLLDAYDVSGGDTVYVDDEWHAVHLLTLQQVQPGLRCRPAGPLMATLRGVKAADELAALQRAADLVDETVEECWRYLRTGMTERDLAAVIARAYENRGTYPAFDITVCFGENTAIPHHRTSDRTLRRGDLVLVDTGCVADGYCSDITRTVAYGEPSDALVREVYELVYAAHHAARAAVRPGVPAEEVDAAARKVIADAGYGEAFNHRLGHGIGLSVHEPPNMVAGNKAPLKAGQCFSVEPGVYFPGRFGVRIENIVACTDNGCLSFNTEAPAALRVIEPR
jgi:Xaa-Pro aminopeptidase